MGHIAQFRVLNPHQCGPVKLATIARYMQTYCNFKTLHNGCLNQRHMPKRGQIKHSVEADFKHIIFNTLNILTDLISRQKRR